MYYTNEYTVLMPIDGTKEKIIKPGKINAFGPITGQFKVSSSARILELATNNLVAILEVGKVYNGIGQVPPPPKKEKVDKGLLNG